ncbi:HNH endonuclease signature motif containing protein [Gordonia zhaorongruii]|uniref:HNH endonuclease signature motif containing protein n=1 Tax=Gordonia zhaorongruii TaxID=2597659 RepID=UPI001F20A85C|nr:HNH endonuclease signature motif containing protein [Gordonia zhaorongruii]
MAPPTTDRRTDSDRTPRLAESLQSASRTGLNDAEILATTVELVRLRNLADATLSAVIATAGRVGIPFRKRVTNPAGLLTAIGVPPAIAHRTVRNGAAAERLPAVGSATRNGALSAENADAVGKGIAFIEHRVALDDGELRRITSLLLVQDTPGDVARRARQFAIELAVATDDAERVPAAENAGLNEMSLTVDDEGRINSTLNLDVLTGEELSAAIDPLCRPVLRPDGSPDPRSTSQRRADALGQIVRNYLAGSNRPTSGGVLPHATLIIPAATVDNTGSGHVPSRSVDDVASLGFAGPISPATVSLVLCDAAVSAVSIDKGGAPLDVGREHRLVTPAIRKALTVRDRGCAFPGCGRPASWTDAHHCVPWSEGGETSVDNGVLLCRMHHTMIHHSGWEVFIGEDRQPYFLEPVDPAHPRRRRSPIRSHGRRTMTAHPVADAA